MSNRRYLDPHRGVTLEIIDTFRSFIELGNISKVAEVRGLTQPAITHQLKKFEEVFQPAQLFVSEGRRKQPTALAIALNQLLGTHLNSLDESLSDLIVNSTGLKLPNIKMGLRRELAQKVVSRLDYKGSLEIVEMPGHIALQKLKERQLDMAVTQERPLAHEFLVQPLFKDSPRVAIHKSLVPKERLHDWYLNPQFLEATSALFYKQRSPFFTDWMSHIGSDMRRVNPLVVCDDWLIVVRMLEAARGFTILPSSFHLNPKQILWYDIPPGVISSTTFFAYVNKEFVASEALTQLWQDLGKQFADL